MRKLLVTITALLVFSGPVFAGWDEGVAAFKQGKYQDALNEFQKVVDQNPDAFSGHYMLGLSLRGLKRKEESLNHLRKAYDLNPNDLSIKIELGRAYVDVRRYPEAAALLGKVPSADIDKLDERRKGAFYKMRAGAREKSKDEGGAFADYKTLARLYPQDAQIQHKYGILCSNSNLMSDALTALDKAARAAPKDQSIKRSYITVLKKQGRVQRDKNTKKQTYLKASNLAKELVGLSGSYDNLLLQCEVELGASLYADAVGSCRGASSKKSGDWLAKFYLGQAYSSNKQFAEAEAPLKEATGMVTGKDQKQIWRQLGFVYEKQKKYADSVEAYNAAGDGSAAARVQENEDTANENARIEDENARIEAMRKEAAELEKQLKEIEGGGGR